MSNYWKNHYDLNSKQFGGSPLKQVGKTINGQEISELQVQLIVENIANVLRLIASDSVIDLCCGNGLITRQLATLVKEVVGIDFSSGLIEAAKKNNGFNNIEYICSDILNLDSSYLLGKKKVVMYEALQYFSVEQLGKLLNELNGLEVGSLILLGGIPNKEKLNLFYDTDEKYAFYMRGEIEGKPHIGQWWLMNEIKQLASAHVFKATFLAQPPALYTAHYRFDVLLEKCQ